MNPSGTGVPTPKAVSELYVAPGKMGPAVVVIERPESAKPPPLPVSHVKVLPLATVPPSSNVPVRDNAIVDADAAPVSPQQKLAKARARPRARTLVHVALFGLEVTTTNPSSPQGKLYTAPNTL
jgi:hypothetical protein